MMTKCDPTSLVLFKSSSPESSGRHHLSNLAPAMLKFTWPLNAPPCVSGRTCQYPTSEHAYQATKALDAYSAAQFECGGLVCMEAFKRWPKGRSGTVVRFLIEALLYVRCCC